MKTILKIAALVVIVVVLNACGGDDDPSPSFGEDRSSSQSAAEKLQSEWGGQLTVYERILGETDCATLQAEFDTAGDNNDRAEPGSGEHRWTIGYMTAADDRMESVGCYR